MLLQIDEDLEEKIVRILSAQSPATAQELQRLLSKEGQKYSLQGIYKELRKLQREGVILKVRERYQPTLSWMYSVVDLSRSLQSNYLVRQYSGEILPQSGENRRWVLTDFLRLDDLWLHLIMCFFQQAREPVMYEWLPHPWFLIFGAEKEKRMNRCLEKHKGRIYAIIGGDSLLDKIYCKNWEGAPVQLNFSSGPFEDQRCCYYSLLDDFLLTVKVPKKEAEVIDKVFETSGTKAEASEKFEKYLLNQKVRVPLLVEHNPEKAKVYRRKFKDYFGV